MQVDIPAAGIVAVGLDNHGEMRRDVAVIPIGIAHGRLDFRDVQELVDEGEQALALPLDGACVLPDRFRVGILQVMAQSEYHGERRTEFVGDVGEEVLA